MLGTLLMKCDRCGFEVALDTECHRSPGNNSFSVTFKVPPGWEGFVDNEKVGVICPRCVDKVLWTTGLKR